MEIKNIENHPEIPGVSMVEKTGPTLELTHSLALKPQKMKCHWCGKHAQWFVERKRMRRRKVLKWDIYITCAKCQAVHLPPTGERDWIKIRPLGFDSDEETDGAYGDAVQE